ncbi:hypothetical protein [Pseudomonas knackmussii]|uniref:hypothetical protein n=1 Tax=Pseudomonas knackmussii TaxID=65741 RepID=UPI003F4A5039
MKFWLPSRRKLATFALLLFLAFVCAVLSKAANSLQTHYGMRLLEASDPNGVKAYKEELRSSSVAQIRKFPVLSNDDAKQLEYMSWALGITNVVLPLFFAYLAACVIHAPRRPRTSKQTL